MADVFISYSSVDRDLAAGLGSKLSALGMDVWWDNDLIGGDAFRDEIARQLAASRKVIVIWSANSVGSRYVLDEADYAVRVNKLVSVLADGFPVTSIPLGFGKFQAIGINNDAGLKRAVQRAADGSFLSNLPAPVSGFLPNDSAAQSRPAQLPAHVSTEQSGQPATKQVRGMFGNRTLTAGLLAGGVGFSAGVYVWDIMTVLKAIGGAVALAAVVGWSMLTSVSKKEEPSNPEQSTTAKKTGADEHQEQPVEDVKPAIGTREV